MSLEAILTVELVLQPAAVSEHSSLHLLAWENPLEHGTKQVIREGPSHDAPADEATESIVGPSHFALQCFQVEGFEVEQRGHRTAGDVVAGKGEEVAEHREAEGDEKATYPGSRSVYVVDMMFGQLAGHHSRPGKLVAVEFGSDGMGRMC